MRNFFKNLLLSLSSIFITLLFLELCLRLAGNAPFKYLSTTSPHTIFKNDDKLGWDTMPGNYSLKIFNNKYVNYKILNDGSRFSGDDFKINSKKNKIIFVGGSFTLGQAINDEETLTFQLQKNIKNYQVKNFGVSGYGSYQSYLKLKKILDKFENIDYVIYPFIDHHEIRNIGDASWLEFLSKNARAPVSIPYVKLSRGNEIIEYSPVKYIVLPYSDNSVLISKIQKKLMRIIFYSKNKDKTIITKKIILKMNKLSKEKGSKFILVNLYSDKSKINDYESFSTKNNIEFINCQIELDDKHIVKNESHPNGIANKKFSDCVLKLIKI